MFARRLVTSFGLVLLAAACSQDLTSPPVVPTAAASPHFIRWASNAASQFSAQGVASERLIGGVAVNGGTVPAPLFDYTSSASATAASLSWSHTVGTGSNRLLVVGVSVENGRTVSAVTWKGVPLRQLTAQDASGGLRAEQWYLTAPASGTGTVAVSLSGSASVVAGAVSFSGVDQFAPFEHVAAATSTGTSASVAVASASNEVVLSTLAIDGNATTRTPATGQTARWNRAAGSSDVAGAASTVAGAASVTMRWTASSSQPWALAAASIKPFVSAGLGLTTYQVTFWAKRGQTRSFQINYAANGGTQPFLQFTASDPTYVPGRGNLAVGDSVLVTATVDPTLIAVDLQPTGVLFGTPSMLRIWYGGANGDLNGDGVVNGDDATIESQLLGMWYQEGSSNPWTAIAATKNLTEKSFTAPIQHFSGYSVSW